MRSIAVLRAGALGDVLLTLPALAALRRRYPAARLQVIGYPSIWRVAGPLVDEILSIDTASLAGLLTGTPAPALEGTDLLVAWSARAPAPLPGAILLHASPYPPPGVHAADWILQTLDLPPVPETDLLRLTPAEFERAGHILSVAGLTRPIVIHPGAGAAWKRWPPECFAGLAQQLVDDSRPVALLQGPADAGAIAAVQAHLARPLPVIREPDLRVLATLLARAAAYVGNDSGVTHLAALAGTPTTALFGPTDPVSWAPRGATVLRTCRSSSARQGDIRVCHNPICMAGIAVETVLAQLAAER